MPGFVSTLFHHMYSAPLRSVQMFLQAMLQVWQPMHLSRWNTIDTCARTFMLGSFRPHHSSRSSFFTTQNVSRLKPVGPQ